MISRLQFLSRWLLLIGIVIGAVVNIRAQLGQPRASKPDVRKAVVETVEGQLAAFRAGDVKKAYGFAAAALKAQTPQRQFQRIVEVNYPEIWKNTRSEIGLVRDDGTHAMVLVQVYTKDGSAGYDYTFVKEKDGVWRIDGVLRHSGRKDERV